MTHERLIRDAYAAFNRKDADAALNALHRDVTWADGKGGVLHGHDEVRKHWLEQWAGSSPTIELLGFAHEHTGRVTANIRLVIRNARGEVVSDREMQNLFGVEAGLIKRMQIPDERT